MSKEGKDKKQANVEDKDTLDQELPEALIASFNVAVKAGRIRLGLSESLELLDYDPSSIVLCVLPHVEKMPDPLKHMHLRLMEAFCKEHSIRMVKVTSMEGFCALLKWAQQINPANPYDHCDVEGESSDLLIIEATQGICPEDDSLKAKYDAAERRSPERAPPILPAVFPTFFEA